MEVINEGREIYVTKSGEKYHLNQRCEKLKGYRSYERKACVECQSRTEGILTVDPNISPPQKQTELTFVYEDELYHHEDCGRITHTRRKGNRPICLVCESEERMLL